MKDTYDMFAPPERGRFGENETQHRPGRGPRVTGASDLVDITLRLVEERPLSIAVADPAKLGSQRKFLPKSQIEYLDVGQGMVQVSMPQWLAREKGLV